MKKQTFIVHGIDKDGNKRNFYRFAYKDPKKVLKVFQETAAGGNNYFWLWSWGNDNIVSFACYATPDGATESDLVWNVSLKDLMSK